MMTRSTLSSLKTLGALSASLILFGCSDPEIDDPTPTGDMAQPDPKVDMGGDDSSDPDASDLGPGALTPLERAQAKRREDYKTALCEVIFECPGASPRSADRGAAV